MAHTTMSLPAIYDYAKDVQNIDIFEFLSVPASIDRDELINLILMRSAPFEVQYPNATYLHAAIKTWSITHQRTFNKWADALAIAYDPLNNYDRTEEMNESGLETRDKKSRDKASANTFGATSDNTHTSGDTTNKVSAFDSSDWSNSDKSDVTSGATSNGSDLRSSESNSEAGENENSLHSKDYKLRAFGNIGVTTSQQMLQSELDIDAWNIYEHIADLFLDEFCVLLY